MAFGNLNQKDHDDDGDMAEINIIPLVDVMLVLLIIFMVTAPMSIGGIKVDLPYSKAKSAVIDEDRIVLSVNAAGQFYFDKVQIPELTLESKLKGIFQTRKKKELYIRADHAVPYGRIVQAMSAAKSAGVVKLGMLTQEQAVAK